MPAFLPPIYLNIPFPAVLFGLFSVLISTLRATPEPVNKV
jgi:hypothetical protein